ncbi:MAG TPA: MlaD family protein, partial [Thermoanaerobaculia bacterium]|nr:MlaD family protein [Thermoanaerobaculia bacterium]
GGGDSTRDFKGQEYAPVLTPPEAGKTFILETNGLNAGAVGAPVQFHGIRAGMILGSEYDEARHVTAIHAFVVQRFVNHVTTSTRFFRAGGLSFSLSGAGVSMNGASLSSLLSAPIEFITPDVMPGPPAADSTRFELFDSQQQAEAAVGGPQLTYVTYFPGPVDGLQPGTKVQMKGVDVGLVQDVRLQYVPQNATLQTPVTIAIDPRKLGLAVDRTILNDALSRLINKGMRATLNSSLVLPGASGVSLDFVARAGTGRLVVEHDPPIIPAASSGNGIQGVLARISNLPIEDIASHLQSTVARVDELVHDPALSDSLHKLNSTLTDVQKVAAVTRENAGPIAQSLRNAAATAEQAAGRANQLLATAPQQNYDLGSLIKELTRAAESIRALADYLTEHPDSLLKGRGK